MKKKINLVLIILIIIIVTFLLILSFYKFGIKNNNKDQNDEKYGIFDVGMEIEYLYDINYLEEYKNNILTDIVKEVEYSMIFEDNLLYGKVYIGQNNKLYIYDELYKKSYLVLDKNVKTIYSNAENSNFCSVFAITTNGELYYISLTQPLISSLVVEKIDIPNKVVNFTNINLNYFVGTSLNSVVVLTNDGFMYDSLTLTRYNPNTLNVINKYIVYETNYISNINRKFLVNSKNEKYKVKVIAMSNEPIKDLKNHPNIIIITEDDKLIYLADDNKVYEYIKKIKLVGSNDNNLIVVVFEDDKYITFEGFYNSKFYPVLVEQSDENKTN